MSPEKMDWTRKKAEAMPPPRPRDPVVFESCPYCGGFFFDCTCDIGDDRKPYDPWALLEMVETILQRQG